MAHGGARQNAGRKKGTSSKIPLEKAIQAVNREDYKTPLEVMLKIMNDNLSSDVKLALEAAKGAAPYMHAKLIESKNENRHFTLENASTEELQRFLGQSRNSDKAE